MPGRILIDPQPSTGAWNMAVDEVLLEAAIERNAMSVRWYGWREATVSLGYFQQEAANRSPGLAALPVVRRLTGGGAILHHRELTYSCALPAGHALARDPLRLYDAVHRAIIAVLAVQGVRADLRGAAAVGGHEPFLCFGRGDPRDVLVGGYKVLGSAQRRRRGAVLQHGSLLLEASQFAPIFPGLNDLARRRCLGVEHAGALALGVAAALGGEWSPQALNAGEHGRAAVLSEERYSRVNWQRRRVPERESAELTVGARDRDC
ncbi:MAG TPA: hypothetical protein VML55_11445 [Planctomycetaceae bacterium]|nr:hypothetical protein [Planctomycetaceae bacterium]